MMSTKHLLDTEGAVVCGASPREDGSNVTSNVALATCQDCGAGVVSAPGMYDEPDYGIGLASEGS